MIPVRGVEHIGLFSRDTEALADWYRDTFGAKEVSRSDGAPPIIFLSFGGGALIELIPKEVGIPTDHVHICFSVEGIVNRVEALRSRDITIEREIFAAYEGSEVAFFRDPEGNLLQLVERVSGSGVDAAVYGIAPE